MIRLDRQKNSENEDRVQTFIWDLLFSLVDRFCWLMAREERGKKTIQYNNFHKLIITSHAHALSKSAVSASAK